MDIKALDLNESSTEREYPKFSIAEDNFLVYFFLLLNTCIVQIVS